MKTESGVSPAVPSESVLISLVVFTLVYAALMVADIYLLVRYARVDPDKELVPLGAY
jgi:cytochrome d ubiquinol oxidase subunit I